MWSVINSTTKEDCSVAITSRFHPQIEKLEAHYEKFKGRSLPLLAQNTYQLQTKQFQMFLDVIRQ